MHAGPCSRNTTIRTTPNENVMKGTMMPCLPLEDIDLIMIQKIQTLGAMSNPHHLSHTKPATIATSRETGSRKCTMVRTTRDSKRSDLPVFDKASALSSLSRKSLHWVGSNMKHISSASLRAIRSLYSCLVRGMSQSPVVERSASPAAPMNLPRQRRHASRRLVNTIVMVPNISILTISLL